MHLNFFFCLALLIFSQGCNNSTPLYTKSFNNDSWSARDTLIWSSVVHNNSSVELQICHNDSYGYENLYLKGSASVDTNLIWNEVFNVSLMDENGFWLGKKSGKCFCVTQKIFDIDENLNAKTISFILNQYSREDKLSGIDEIRVVSSRNK